MRYLSVDVSRNGNALLLLSVVLFCCSPDLPILAECLLPHLLPDC
jgi:hypothetical protein